MINGKILGKINQKLRTDGTKKPKTAQAYKICQTQLIIKFIKQSHRHKNNN